MIDPSTLWEDQPPWLICESHHRWSAAVARFWSDVMPPDLRPSIAALDPSSTLQWLQTHRGVPVVVLWERETDAGGLLRLCDWVLGAEQVNPRALQMVAASAMTGREQTVLRELSCAAVIRNVEDLLSLRPMIRGYFGS